MKQLKFSVLLFAIWLLLSSCGLKNESVNPLSSFPPAPSPSANASSPEVFAEEETIAPSKRTPSPSPKGESPIDITPTKSPAPKGDESNSTALTNNQTASPSLKNTITLSILAPKGYILQSTQIEFQEGESVFDLLKKTTRSSKIQMEFRGSGKTAYVVGIDNVYEFDLGPESGWLYFVNDKLQNVSCGAYVVKQGDRVEWKYTKNLGKDQGASY